MNLSNLRIGILARAENRGIGIQTWEAFNHLPNTKALIVDPGRWGQGFPMFFDRYRNSPDVLWDDRQQFDERDCRRWLEGIDVLYAVETFYDPRLIDWARDQGVATVLHTNPELHKPLEAGKVDQVWLPTPWRAEHVPEGRLVPYPVTMDHFPRPQWDSVRDVQRPRVLHVAGKQAMMDRNGTKLVAAATEHIRGQVTVVSQDIDVPLGRGALRLPATAHYSDLYCYDDVLLMPRRYGGLCLPIQEAKAAGMAIVTLDTPPHDWYEPAAVVPAEEWGTFPSGSGDVPVYTCRCTQLADAVNELTGQRLLEARMASRAWAVDHSWWTLRDVWLDAFDEARNAMLARAAA